MKAIPYTLLILGLMAGLKSNAQEPEENKSHSFGPTLFIELVGKAEYFSVNTDFRLYRNHRLGFGVTLGSFEVNDTSEGNEWEQRERFAPGFMYYFLIGKKKSYFELGTGASILTNYKYDYKLEPFLIHAVIGYRMQTKKGFLLRAGFTPQYQPPDGFMPLVGLSLGYSW